jgi:hypothetical protein
MVLTSCGIGNMGEQQQQQQRPPSEKRDFNFLFSQIESFD